MKQILLFPTLLLASFQGFANTNRVEIDTTTINSQFFVAIIAGVLLALIFQIILTALSVAMGISMIGNLKQSYVDSKVKPSSNNDNDEYTFDQDYNNNNGSTGVKISTAFGVWSLFTTAISLFGACALALNLSFFGSVASNITVALVIWALFFLILFYLETKIVNTVVGGLVTTATSGLKSSANLVKQLFTKSEEKKVQGTINSTIDKIRKEFDINLNTSELSVTLDKFLKNVDNKLPDYDTLKSDLEGIAKKSKSSNSAGKYMAIQQVLTKAIDKADKGDAKIPKGKVEHLKSVLSDLKQAYTSDGSTVEGVKDVITEYTSLEKSQIDEKINEVKDYIKNATPESFSKDNLSKDLESILSDPKSMGTILSSKFKDFDKNKIIETLSQNTNLDKNQLNNYADKISNTIDKTRKTIEENDINSIKASAEKSIESFFNNTDRDELQYDDLKKDLNAIYNNPKDSLSIIKSRLNKMDGDTVKALITNNKYIDEKDIDKVTSKVNETIDSIKSQVSSIEQKAHEQFEMTKRKAVIQAEHARKTAASAAWWLVITVLVSGGAAMLGAWLELT
ncbi:MAG: hypothetical protein WA775_00525 [Psychroserpens sp.]|uniref:hypothetical protein n=1 Tax=Psychroserpens sp. TaxID=2020870 RepID=UPI003CB5F9DF